MTWLRMRRQVRNDGKVVMFVVYAPLSAASRLEAETMARAFHPHPPLKHTPPLWVFTPSGGSGGDDFATPDGCCWSRRRREARYNQGTGRIYAIVVAMFATYVVGVGVIQWFYKTEFSVLIFWLMLYVAFFSLCIMTLYHFGAFLAGRNFFSFVRGSV